MSAAEVARPYAVAHTAAISFIERDGVALQGDLWAPQGLSAAPALVAVHGGAWQTGERARYRLWGPYLAQRGYALFSVDYRLSRPGVATFPAAAQDVAAAVRFLRANALRLGVDPARIGMIGDSAGAHLSALSALASREPWLAEGEEAATDVKAVVGVYGIYDLLAQWEHDQIERSGDQIVEKFLGCAPRENRRLYFDASPMSYATASRNATRFLLVDGGTDDIVDTPRQADAFLTALKNANFVARRLVIPAAGHFWIGDPIEEPGSYCGVMAPHLLRFLQTAL